MITGVSKVVVPVDDQERAKEFWTTRVGFELRRDASYGDQRWIEVSPPDGGPLLVLSPRAADEPRARGGQRAARTRRCSSTAPTSRRPTASCASGASTFPLPPQQQHFGWWALFEDPDGTRYALGQWD